MALTKQAAFNKVWRHFIIRNGAPSLVDGVCAYRGPHGAKCAIGVLIPARLATPEWLDEHNVGVGWSTLSVGFRRKIIKGKDADAFSERLQQAHDTCSGSRVRLRTFKKDLEYKLRLIADDFFLEIPKR